MALYEYSCKKCGKKFEKIVPMSDCDKPQPCPECGTESEQVPAVPSQFAWGGGKAHWSL